MKILILLLILSIAISCNNSNDLKADFEKHKYDLAVINNLPLYDSLRLIIVENYDSFYLTGVNYSFTYLFKFDTLSTISGFNNKDVPKNIYPQTVRLFEKIGQYNIFGFVINQDSTIEMLVRNTHLAKYFLDIRERLYWQPTIKSINKGLFPIKDTLLTNQWRYRIWYDKRARF